MNRSNNQIPIYLDTIVFRIQKFGGASTYYKELLNNFVKKMAVKVIVQSHDINLLNEDGRTVLQPVDQGELVIEASLPASILRYLPLTKRLPAYALYHSSYYRTCFQKSVVNIFTIHDFTHKKGYASKFPRKLIHIGLTAIGLKNADGIICISENTKKDLMHYYPQLPEERLRVIYHGVGNEFYPIQSAPNKNFNGIFSLEEPFVLFVGKRSGYKKYDIIPGAVKAVDDLKLVIVGGGKLTQYEVEELERLLPGRYYKLDGVNNGELNILYNFAFCLLYPSVYEGFGIPVLEAMKAGCPVITNHLSSLQEVAGDAALIVNEISAEAIANKLKELDDKQVRTNYINAGLDRSKKFTWDKCFKETYLFYQEIYNRKLNKINAV